MVSHWSHQSATLLGRSVLVAAVVVMTATAAYANFNQDESFDATVAGGGSGAGWFNWGLSGFHSFGGNPDWGSSAALYAGADTPDTAGVFYPQVGTSQGASLESVTFELQVDLFPQVNYATLLQVGIQWRNELGGNTDVVGEDVIDIDLTNPLVDPNGITRGQYNTVTAEFTAPAGAYWAVIIIQQSNVVATITEQHWCYIDNVKLNVVDNLVLNPGFEANLDGSPWIASGNVEFANWGGRPNRHAWCRIEDLAAEGMLEQPGVCGVGGNSYELSLFLAFQFDWFGDLEYGFRWFDANGQLIAEDAALLIVGMTPYQRYTYSAIAPALTDEVRPFVRWSNVLYVPDPVVDNSATADNAWMLLTSGTPAPDTDEDSIKDCADVCPAGQPGAPVDAEGRPIADLDDNCGVGQSDVAILMASYSGP